MLDSSNRNSDSEPNVGKFIPLNSSMNPQKVVLKSYFGLSWYPRQVKEFVSDLSFLNNKVNPIGQKRNFF